MSERELWVPFAVAALWVAFAIVSLAVHLLGARGPLLRAKLWVGGMLLTLTGVATVGAGCVMCYRAEDLGWDTDTDTDTDTDADTDTDTDSPAELVVVPTWDPADFDIVVDVGPGREFEELCELPWEALEPGTLVRIHHREEPYRCKWAMDVVASEERPVVVLGVPDGEARPVISGDGAATPQGLDFWSEGRGIIKVGGTSSPGPSQPPSWIWIQGIEIRSAHPGYGFTDDAGGAQVYEQNAAAVFLEEGEHLFVVDSVLQDCGNGLFSTAATADVHVVANHLHGNGIADDGYHHNSYTESLGITFEHNRYGALREGAEGNNLKDRSAGTVIRYNWIEGGNRQLDLVETGSETLRDDPRYRETFVYGNVLVEHDDGGNSQILHYGGDGGEEGRYRGGVLYFFHNTVLSLRGGNTTLLRLSTDNERAVVRNSIVHATAGEGALALYHGTGAVELSHSWISEGWVATHESDVGAVKASDVLEGSEPGFEDAAELALHLTPESAAIGAAAEPLEETEDHPVDRQYLEHQGGDHRPSAEDLGAFEG
jgi:hypothetical protein